MKEIRAIGLISFHRPIIQLRIQRFLLLRSKTRSDDLFNLILRPFNFPLIFHSDKKDVRSHVALPL